MTSFTNRIKPDSTELERYFLSVYTGNLWDALEKIKDWHSPEHIEKEVQMKLLKIQHQPLPVVPEFVAEYIEECKKNKYALNLALDLMAKEYTSRKTELSTWIMSNQEQFAKAYFDKYTVQKPKRFYLKNKLTRLYLFKAFGYSKYGEQYELRKETDFQFTQEEIDKMEDTGSYEKIEVEE